VTPAHWPGTFCALGFLGLVPAAALAGGLPYLVPDRTISAPAARQGVASDGSAVYAVDNSRIARIDLASSRETARFEGDPALFPHLNSCTVTASDLVCAASNYPAVPHAGVAEFFDRVTLAHRRTVAMPENPGSLTVLDRHDGRWWAVFANYDGKGGVAGQNHRDTILAEMDEEFRIRRRWRLPESVLTRVAPRSISGASWDAQGRLWASGHDKPELYLLALPARGDVLDHAGTFAVATFGQAIDVDPADPGLVWTIDRKRRLVVASRLPEAAPTQGTGP
jgi:hypothetical protein